MLAYQDTGGSEGGLPADHLESVDALLRECGLGTSRWGATVCPRCVRPVAPTRPIDPGRRPDGGGAVASDNPFGDSGGRNTEPEDRETEDFDEEACLDLMVYLLELEGTQASNLDQVAHVLAPMLLQEPEHWELFVSASAEDPLAWKVLRVMVELLRGRSPEQLIGPLLNEWVLDAVTGRRKEPRRRGRDSRVKRIRYFVIATAVKDLSSLGDRTETSSNYNLANSACHVVARACAIPYETVRSIYQRYRRVAMGDPESPIKSPLKVKNWLIS